MQASMDGIAIHDAEGRFLWLNEAHAAAHGYAVPELLGRSWRVLYDDRELARFDAEVLPTVASRGHWRGAALGRRKDGHPFPQELSLSALEDGGMACVVRDVSDLRREQEALRSAHERIGAIVSAAPVVLFALDEAGLFTVSEGKGLEALGLRPGEVVGRSVFEVYRGVPEIHANMRRALEGEAFTSTIALGDRVYETHHSPLVDASGRRRGMLGVSLDVTERARAQEALLHAQKLESLRVLAGGVAHDFNNLLVGVLGNASLLLAELPQEARVRPMVEHIELAARRATDLTRQLLAYAGKARVSTLRLDLSAVALEMMHLLGAAVAKGTLLETRLDRDLPAVEGDAGQIRQVVMNLVVNASEALGGRLGTVRISTMLRSVAGPAPRSVTRVPELRPGTYVALEVADTGSGIDERTRERIFDPFFTTKPEGRGLGLAVAMGVVRSHGGAIEVESEPGRGSTFRVLLPRSAPSRPAREPVADEEAAGPVHHGQGRVLVVEDEARVRAVLSTMLESLGYEPVLATDATEGLARLRERPGDLAAILLDLTMPGMAAEEAFRAMRRAAPRVRIVLMSGYDRGDALARFGDAPPEDFLSKPFTLQALSDRLRSATLPIG